MSEILNERDLYLRNAPLRVIPAPAPEPIIEGFTGISLFNSPNMFFQTGVNTYSPAKMLVTAKLQGIPATQAVDWLCNMEFHDTSDPLVKELWSSDIPAFMGLISITATVPYGGQTFFHTLEISVFRG